MAALQYRLDLSDEEYACLLDLVLNPANANLRVADLCYGDYEPSRAAEPRYAAVMTGLQRRLAVAVAPERPALRPSWDEWFTSLAYWISARSTCLRASVGAVLVDPATHTLVATGYNGAPPGEKHCLDAGCLMVDGHCKRTIHAERNAVLQAGDRARGAVLYLVKKNTDSVYGMSQGVAPCADCARLLKEAGVQLARAAGAPGDHDAENG